jgi:Transcriptional regulator DsbA
MSNKTVISTFGTFTDKELSVLKGGMKELSDVFTMQESQREVVKEIIERVHEELKIPKKIIRKMAQTWHKRNYNEVVAEQQEFEVLYEGIVSDNQTA